MAEEIKVIYKGATIQYREFSNDWRCDEVNKGNGCPSLQYVKEKIDGLRKRQGKKEPFRLIRWVNDFGSETAQAGVISSLNDDASRAFFKPDEKKNEHARERSWEKIDEGFIHDTPENREKIKEASVLYNEAKTLMLKIKEIREAIPLATDDIKKHFGF